MVFKRKIYNKMLAWKQEANGSTALLVEGARRIGKSTIVKEFVKNEYRSHIFIDFSIASREVHSLFTDLSDINYLFLRLQLLYNTVLTERQSAIVFDEVQLCPQARQAIKHLVNDRRYDYIETGSLISLKKNVKDILIPSEEKRLPMVPLDYEEFCWATHGEAVSAMLWQAVEGQKPLGEAAHRQMMRRFRLYMLIGGMPQAIAAYMETNNFRLIDEVKKDILSLYADDFQKLDQTGKLSLLFAAIPSQLNNNASRYQVSSVLKNDRANSLIELLAEMQASQTVLTAYHANDPNAGLSAYQDLAKFKLFLADTGLFVTLMFKNNDFTENVIYEKLLSDTMRVNLGYVYENIVAQILAANGHRLYYHTFLNKKSRHNYEIDFLLREKNKICPLEVKSSGYKKHVSLDAFAEKYSSRIGTKYLVYTKDFQKDGDVLCVPVYWLPFIT